MHKFSNIINFVHPQRNQQVPGQVIRTLGDKAQVQEVMMGQRVGPIFTVEMPTAVSHEFNIGDRVIFPNYPTEATREHPGQIINILDDGRYQVSTLSNRLMALRPDEMVKVATKFVITAKNKKFVSKYKKWKIAANIEEEIEDDDLEIPLEDLEGTLVDDLEEELQPEFQTITPEVTPGIPDDLQEDLEFEQKIEDIEQEPINYEEEAERELEQEQIAEEIDRVEEIDEEQQEELEEVLPELPNTFTAIQYAIDNNLVMAIDYTAMGTPGRRDKIRLKRETGVNIHRIIEPHYIFLAPTTGNTIVTGYDRSVRRIRSFIIDNITNYEFTGKEFRPRIRIIGKGIQAMDIFEKLQKIGDELEKKGHVKEANAVTSHMERLLNIKTAQYVGVQGYWIRNDRCWQNCYRHKRTAESNKPVQQVWSECWQEYLNYLKDPDNDNWSKYAQEKGQMVKEASSVINSQNRQFVRLVRGKVEDGQDLSVAIQASLNEIKGQKKKAFIDLSVDMAKLSENLQDKKIAEKLMEASGDILKEANWLDRLRGWGKKKEPLTPPVEGVVQDSPELQDEEVQQGAVSGRINTQLEQIAQSLLGSAINVNQLIYNLAFSHKNIKLALMDPEEPSLRGETSPSLAPQSPGVRYVEPQTEQLRMMVRNLHQLPATAVNFYRKLRGLLPEAPDNATRQNIQRLGNILSDFVSDFHLATAEPTKEGKNIGYRKALRDFINQLTNFSTEQAATQIAQNPIVNILNMEQMQLYNLLRDAKMSYPQEFNRLANIISRLG